MNIPNDRRLIPLLLFCVFGVICAVTIIRYETMPSSVLTEIKVTATINGNVVFRTTTKVTSYLDKESWLLFGTVKYEIITQWIMEETMSYEEYIKTL